METPVAKLNPNVALVCITALLIGGGYVYTQHQPVPTVPDAPSVSTIADTVPDERTRKQLSAYMLAWSRAMPYVRNLGHFRSAMGLANQTIQDAGKLEGSLADFQVALNARLEKAVGLEPSRTDLDPLVVELVKISEELK